MEMLCQRCGKNSASISVKSISGGKLAEYALCAECARELGYGNFLTGPGYHLDDFVHEFFNGTDDIRCKCCGSSFSDIVRSGRAGCAECYRTFYDRLLPIIRQIHGSDTHRGKIPGGALPQVRLDSQITLSVGGGDKPDGGGTGQ